MTRLPQGATNPVAQLVRIVTKTLKDYILDMARHLVDDVGVKGLKAHLTMRKSSLEFAGTYSSIFSLSIVFWQTSSVLELLFLE